MIKFYLRNLLIALFFPLILTSSIFSVYGPGGGYSAAPGEQNCTSCHTGTLITSGTKLNKLLLIPHFRTNGYDIDSTYSMEITFKNSGTSKFGFEVTCLNSSNNDPAGSFSAPNSRVQKTTANISGKTRSYIEQTSTGASSVATDSTRWVFTWKAPASNVGKVKFYVIVNATNNDGNITGDVVYAKAFEFSCSDDLPIADASTNDPTTTCTGYKISLKGSGTKSPTSWSWKFTGANLPGTGQQNPTINFTGSGTQYAILTATNSFGSSRPDTIRFNVRQSPPVSITNGVSGTICSGDSMLLSANTTSNVTYSWKPFNQTTKTIYARDSGIYTVTNTSTVNGCSATSANFKLTQLARPSISISGTTANDSFCRQFSGTLNGSGNNIDSVLWYADGNLFARKKGMSLPFTSTQKTAVYAVAKSTGQCLSVPSNTLNIKVSPKLYPLNVISSKTTSTIRLQWIKPVGVDSFAYSTDNTNYYRTGTDTMLLLSNLNPNTTYQVRIRTHQKAPCSITDTMFAITTNACSNLDYTIIADPRTCNGNNLVCTIRNLYKAKYSISFNGGAFGTDTIFSFKPAGSDSLRILIVDSLSPTCPPIRESRAYKVDTLPFESLYGSNILSCADQYQYSRWPLYQDYFFYKNNVVQYHGTSNSYLYKNLVQGDQLKSTAVLNSCSSTAISTFDINHNFTADFTYTNTGRIYKFEPVDTNVGIFRWYVNNVLKSTTTPFQIDMTAYKNSTVTVSFAAGDYTGCADSTHQSVVIPDFTGIRQSHAGNFSVYPNPASGLLHLQGEEERQYTYQLYAMDGRLLNDAAFSGNISIDISAMPPGFYMIRLSNASGVWMVKVEVVGS